MRLNWPQLLLVLIVIASTACQGSLVKDSPPTSQFLRGAATARTGSDGLPAFPTYPNSVWTQPIPNNPRVSANSSAWLQYYLCQNCTILTYESFEIVADSDGGYEYDYHLPYYWAAASDPEVDVVCPPSPSGTPSCTSMTAADPIQIPMNAKYGSYPAPHCVSNPNCPTAFDAHVAFFSANGSSETDIEEGGGLYNLFSQGNSSPKLTVSGADNIPISATNGFDERSNVPSQNGFIGGATASRRLLGAGVILPSELESSINHAIPLAAQCINGTIVPPASPFPVMGPTCPPGPPVPGIPTGARLWLDMSDTSILQAGAGLDTGTQQILLALAHYGGYIVDTTGQPPGQSAPMFALSYALASPYTWTDRGQPDPYPSLAAKLNLTQQNDYTKKSYQLRLDLFPPSQLIKHLKVLDPCVTLQNCQNARRIRIGVHKT